MRRSYPLLLLLAGAVVSVFLLLPFRSVNFERADGVTVQLPAPTRINHTSDTWDYLQLGRELADGNGFRSRFTYVPFLPESVPSNLTEQVDTFPMFWRQPGFPVLVALAMKLGGTGEPDVLIWLQAIAVMLLPLATYVLARRVTSQGWAALAGFWVLLVPLVLGGSVPLVATTWYAVCLAFLGALLLEADRPSRWILTGVVLGLTILLRLETWILLPGLLILHRSAGGSGWRGTAVILGVAVLVMSPWPVRQAMLTGDPFYNTSSLLFHDTPLFPDWDSSRTLAVRELSVSGFVMAHSGDLLAKASLNLARFARDLLLLPSPFLAPFLWLAVLRMPGHGRSRGFVIGGTVAVTLLILVLAPMEYSPRFLAPLVPFLVVGAVLALARFERRRRILAIAATAVGGVMLFMGLAGRSEQGTALQAATDLNALFEEEGAPTVFQTQVALSDSPTLYAWIWNRPAVWAPVATDLPPVRRLLPASFGQFTRAGGKNDGLDPLLIETYRMDGRATSALPPLIITWPEESKDPAGMAP